MNIQKAIEILAAYKAGSYEDAGPDLDDALDLGIKALERIEKQRQDDYYIPNSLLPGETED